MNGKREKTNAHGAGRILSYEPLKVHCDACDQDFNSWESFGRHVDEIVDKPADTRREAVMDVLADHLGDIGMEGGWDDPHVAADGSIKCGCLLEFDGITASPLIRRQNISWNMMFQLIFPCSSAEVQNIN